MDTLKRTTLSKKAAPYDQRRRLGVLHREPDRHPEGFGRWSRRADLALGIQDEHAGWRCLLTLSVPLELVCSLCLRTLELDQQQCRRQGSNLHEDPPSATVSDTQTDAGTLSARGAR